MITLEKISYSYGERRVLSEVSCSFSSKEIIAIVGNNGSGKTTLLKLIKRILKPTTGEVSGVADADIGMVFQNPADQIVYSDVYEDISFGLENQGVKKEEMHARVVAIAQALGIEYLLGREAHTLSFGQTQLVALAGVLVMKPKYLVFDEPTTMLDPKNTKRFWDVVRKLHKGGVGIIFSTNDLRDLKHASRVIVLHDGKVIHSGKTLPKNVLQEAELDA